MKLKLIASLGLLGLIFNPAFAADQDKDTNTQKVTHHKAARHHHRHGARHHHQGVREIATIPTHAPAPCPCPCDCPVYDCYQITMDEISHNLGRARPTVSCNCPITFAGGINFDWRAGNRNLAFAGKNLERFSLNDAYLNIYGNVNCWTKAFMSLSFNNASTLPYFGNASTNGQLFPVGIGQYGAVYNATETGNDIASRVHVEQAYITFANFTCSPFFAQLGKQFVDYGRYHIHPMTRTFVQVLTETLRTAAEIGFITPIGVQGTVSVFDTPLKNINRSNSRYNFTAALGYSCPNEQFGYDLGIAYMYNMLGVNDVAFARNANAFLYGGTINGNYVTRVSSGVVYGDINTGPFTFGFRYTSALSRFSGNDFCVGINNVVVNGLGCQGARPWAYDLDAGYSFCLCNLNNLAYLSYQHSGEAVNIGLPRDRWIGGWGAEVFCNTSLALELGYDRDYSTSKGGSGRNGGLVGVRTSVKFG